MTRPLVKICGVARPGDADLAADLGADLIGLNFYPPSPRCLSVESAREIADAVAGRAPLVGVFVDRPHAEIEEIAARGMLEVQPLTHIRGRSLHDAFVIVDEAQSLDRGVLLTVLSRIGQGSRVVLTHDVAQRDNLRVGRRG